MEKTELNFPSSFLTGINFIHEVKIFNELQNNKKILIFDLRKKEEYSLYCLHYSLNLPYDEHSECDFENFDVSFLCSKTQDSELKEMIKKYKRFYIVIIMSEEKIARKAILKYGDSEGIEKEKIKKSLLLYSALIKNKVRELGLFNLGFRKFLKHYDFIVKKNCCQPYAKDISNFPSEVFDHKIYVGNQEHAMNSDIVSILKITHIVNATMHVGNHFEQQGVKYLNVKIDDTPKYKIANFFREVYEFIEDALCHDCHSSDGDDCDSESSVKSDIFINFNNSLEFDKCLEDVSSPTYKNKIMQIWFKKEYAKFNNQNRILIHCSLGISRSPTLAIMYVMRKFKLGFENAFDFLKFQRNASNPILSFVCELEEFEKNNFKFIDEE